MLYRTLDGKLIEINRFMYVNDAEYYKAILNTKKKIPKVKHIVRSLEDIIKL